MGPPVAREARHEPPGTPFGLLFDCADPRLVGDFWRHALGYVEVTPPEGRASWAGLVAKNRDWYVVLQDPEGNELCLV
jgi:hypothetical protein